MRNFRYTNEIRRVRDSSDNNSSENGDYSKRIDSSENRFV